MATPIWRSTVKAGPATNYRLASVTKQFTATCILLLKQDGKLRLQDHVRKWLPELPASDEAITVYELLTHTGGLIDYEDLIPPGRTAQLDDADVLSLIAAQHRLYFAPWQRLPLQQWRLCPVGPDRAAHFGHGSRGIHESAHLRAARHGPHAAVRAPPRAPGNGAAPMATAKSTASGRRPTRTPRAPPAATVASTRPSTTWPSGTLPSIPTSRSARTRGAWPSARTCATDDPTIGYGFGWRITGDTVWHSGESMGFRNVIVRWPKQHLAVIILSNRNDPQPYPLALAIGQLFLQ